MGHTKHHMKHKKAHGGATSEKGRHEVDDVGSNEMKEVHEKKHGGAVEHGKVHGHKGKHRVKKAHGGKVGSDTHPFSSAHRG
jgi:hypothetical protein